MRRGKFDRAAFEFVASTRRAIGLRDDSLQPRHLRGRAQTRNGKLARAEKERAQYFSARGLPDAFRFRRRRDFLRLLFFIARRSNVARLIDVEDAVEVIDFVAEGAGQ